MLILSRYRYELQPALRMSRSRSEAVSDAGDALQVPQDEMISWRRCRRRSSKVFQRLLGPLGSTASEASVRIGVISETVSSSLSSKSADSEPEPASICCSVVGVILRSVATRCRIGLA